MNNPAKSEIGKISKQLLDSINVSVRKQSGLNQWRNTASTLNWFNTISDKPNCKFLKFDVVEFYPSITEKLLTDAINFANDYANINDEAISTIMHARKSILFCDGNLRVKKSGAEFDVRMGWFDAVEVCELVGLYLLHHLAKIFGKEAVGLYQDDGLAILRNASGPDAERVRKKVTQFFQFQLKVTVDTNLTQTDFLDITLNPRTGRYWPYRKPNDQPLYINVQSNHPPLITKKLPCMIVKRISDISCDVDAFNSSLPVYEEALKQSGHKIQLLPFERAAGRKRLRQRRRKVIWFNPPYNNRVSTNIGKAFFHLLRKHFPPPNRLHKICNKNVIKLSYSCTPNMANILAAHHRGFLSPKMANQNLNSAIADISRHTH